MLRSEWLDLCGGLCGMGSHLTAAAMLLSQF